MSEPTGPLLTVDALSLSFGGVRALDAVSFEVRTGEILALVGPNGAGKTSLLNVVSGLCRPEGGAVTLHGPGGARHELQRLRPHRIAGLGVARTFQNIELFRHMSVLENLMLGRHLHMSGGVLRCGLYWGRQAREEIAHRRRVEDVIDFLNLQPLRHRSVGELAYGQQKLVELGRALALEPRLLLLDEPMAGMNTEEKEQMARFILDVHEEWGVGQLVIDHDMDVVMDVSNRVVVLDFGVKIAEGTPGAVREDPAVLQAYLGENVPAP